MTFIYFIINNYFDNFTAFELIDYELIEHTTFRYFNILSFILYYHRYQKYRCNYFQCNQQSDMQNNTSL